MGRTKRGVVAAAAGEEDSNEKLARELLDELEGRKPKNDTE